MSVLFVLLAFSPSVHDFFDWACLLSTLFTPPQNRGAGSNRFRLYSAAQRLHSLSASYSLQHRFPSLAVNLFRSLFPFIRL